jgi:hypothetical protein
MSTLWVCGHCGSMNLPSGDCLWCLGKRKHLAAALRHLAGVIESEYGHPA